MRNLRGRRECAITAQIFFLRWVEQRSDSAAIFAQQLRKLCCNCSLIEDSIVLFSPFLRWFINEKKVIGDYTTEMIIHNATRDLHDAIVKCEVHNDVGKSEDTETLDITCEYIEESEGRINFEPQKRKGISNQEEWTRKNCTPILRTKVRG